MFTAARWRLTLLFVAVFGLILAVIGVAVLLTARTALFNGLDDDLRVRAAPESRRLALRLLALSRDEPVRGVALGPAFTAGGYFYALTNSDGDILASTANVDPAGLAGDNARHEALADGPTFTNTDSSTGDRLRLYLVPLEELRRTELVLQVGRSREPEVRALRRLLLILAGGGGGGLMLALAGGYLLSGRALAPIRLAMERQRGFVADASHDLRTPLSIIRANAELLKRHPKQPVKENIASVDDIIQETDRLATLVSQMFTLALADADRAPFDFGPVELRTLVEEVGRQAKPLAEAKGLSLTVETDGPALVRGDSVRLRELLLILLDNAIKFTDKGGSIRLALAAEAKRATVSVTDSGRGIPADVLPRIFDRFYRADKARSREEGGAGLGLAIAKWIVDQHHGSIRAASQPDRGTTFTVELPTANLA